MAVITISRQFGSGGDEIAKQVAQTLGYILFDKTLIAQAAMAEGIADKEDVDFSEDSYKMSGFLDRLFGHHEPQLGTLRAWTEDPQGVRHFEELPMTEDHALFLVQKAIRTACDAGNVIIVGRGGQAFLKDCADALHVRIVAPIESCIQRIQASESLKAGAAREMIEARDKASAYYVKHMYNVDVSDASLYHLVLNTGKMDTETAAHLIVEATHSLLKVA
jgi:cytidylate kinase